MGELSGKVALITGAARGQGQAHAVRLASAGADIIAIDICAQIPSVSYAMGTTEDLARTARLVERLDRRIAPLIADVRNSSELKEAVTAGTNALGPIDIVVANAGIAPLMSDTPAQWQDTLDVNLTGVYNTVRTTVQAMVERGAGGAYVLTSSTAGLVGVGGNNPGGLAYTASKSALVGLMRGWANYYAKNSIRFNTIHPTGVNTPMIVNDEMREFLESDPQFSNPMGNALPVSLIEPEDTANAVAWLVSDAARYVTGVTLPVDAGFVNKR